jgi:hypothetical protein
MEVGPRKLRRLVLMDFSLARAPSEHVRAGTPPYLDPFLGTAERPRWDLPAERFSAAMVLHEMAAGTLPRWGDGKAAPQFAGVEATIDRDALPRELAGPLGDFLARALRCDAGERFDTAEDMLRGWRRMFERLDQPTTDDGEVPPDAAAQRVGATLDTPLVAVGLSARAVNALERAHALTVGDLLAIAPIDFNRLRGVGLKTRGELVEVHRELRARLGTPERPSPVSRAVAATPTTDEPDVQGLDALAAQLVPRRTTRNATEVDALRLLLGLDPAPDRVSAWPSQTEVAAALGVTRARVGQVLAKARERWRRLPALTRLRDELAEHTERLGSVATADELERAVAADRGATEGGVAEPPLATAVVRAGVETEVVREEPRIAQRRSGGRVLLACDGDGQERQRALDFAVRLGDLADVIASEDPLPGPAEVAERLRTLRPPPVLTLGQERLVQLAAAASGGAAVSARLELHPRGLPAARALALGRAALLGAEGLQPEDIRTRIAARFPAAEPLPDRPQLDELLRAVGSELRWDPEAQRYTTLRRAELTGATSHVSSVERLATATLTRLAPRTDPAVAEAHAFEERLGAAAGDGGLLVLMVYPQDLAAAARELRRFPVAPIDLDELLLSELHEAADARNVRWDLVLRADGAHRSSQDWARLTALVSAAMPGAEGAIGGHTGTVLLEHLGLLARYEQLGLLGRLRSRTQTGDALRGCWVLVPADDQAELPTVDGAAIAVLTPNEWTRIPRSWLANLHRASRGADSGAA